MPALPDGPVLRAEGPRPPSPFATPRPRVSTLRSAADRASLYVPVLVMGLLALGSYWLVRSTPPPSTPAVQRAVRHDPDYRMHDFSVRNFEPDGRMKSEIFGTEGRHFPDSDTTEVDRPRIRAISERGNLVTATAEHGIANGDGTEVQLLGDAVVTRAATTDERGQAVPQMQYRGDFLHVFTRTERVRSHKPVVLTRGADRFSADALDYDNLAHVIDLRGRVRGTLVPQPHGAATAPAGRAAAPAPTPGVVTAASAASTTSAASAAPAAAPPGAPAPAPAASSAVAPAGTPGAAGAPGQAGAR